MQVRPTLQRRCRESLRAVKLVVLCVVGEFSSELCRAYAFCRGRIFFAQGTKMAAFSPVFRVVVFSCALRKRVRTTCGVTSVQYDSVMLQHYNAQAKK